MFFYMTLQVVYVKCVMNIQYENFVSGVQSCREGAFQHQVARRRPGDCCTEPACSTYGCCGIHIRFNIVCDVRLSLFVVIGTMYEFYIF